MPLFSIKTVLKSGLASNNSVTTPGIQRPFRFARILTWSFVGKILPWLVLALSLAATHQLWSYAQMHVTHDLFPSAGIGVSLLLALMTWLQVRSRTRSLWDAQARQAFREKLEASEERYRGLFNHLHNGFALHTAIRDANGKIIDYRFLEVNRAYEKMVGLSREHLLGKKVSEVLQKTESYWVENFATVVDTGLPQSYEGYSAALDRWLSTDAYRPAPDQVAVIFLDITERKRAFEALHESEERWKFALEGAGDGVWDWNIQEDKVVFSPRYKEMYGFTDEDIASNKDAWEHRIHPDDRARVAADIHAYLEGRSTSYVNEHRVFCKDGSLKWILARGMVVSRDDEGKPLRMIGTHADITERKTTEERVLHLAHFDALTDLPNRALIMDRLQQALIMAKRDKGCMAVMFLDLDKFKPINDTFGHDIGDLLLKDVAKRLLDCVRESDTVARIGGDEFVVLLPTIEQEQDATVVAGKILHALNQPFAINDLSLNISSSIGIAIYPEHGEDEKLLLINADIAMYHAKKHGRDNFQLYVNSMQEMAH